MFKYTAKMLVLAFIFASIAIFNGCQEQQSVNSPDPGVRHLAKVTTFVMPAGATLVSASLKLYAWSWGADPQIVELHNVTSDWSCPVTFNSFGSAFDPAVITTFNTGNAGGGPIWKTIDITSTFAAWLSGGTNYGLFLQDQDPNLEALAEWLSNEYPDPTLRPYLEVVTTAGTIEVEPALDTYLNQLDPDISFCTAEILKCGMVNLGAGPERKYTLIRFDIQPVPPQTEVCGTGYAYGGSIATCFLDISPRSANNWGWTNLITPGYTGQWPLYVGAGQCDISKGTLAGHVDVSYIGGTITIDYVLDPGFTLAEEHVWIGTTLLPLKNGIYQNAPGKFNYNGLDPVVVTGQTGNKYVAVHAGICWLQ